MSDVLTVDDLATNATEKKTNKSKLILAAFKASNLKTPANEIAESIMKEHGVEVSHNLINNLRHRLRKQREDRKAKKAGVLAMPQPTVETPVTGDVVDKLVAVKQFATTVGGLEALKSLLTSLERLAA